MIDTDKLENAILKHLRTVTGRQDASTIWWLSRLQEQIGELPDYAEVVSAMKRLRADGTVRLKKYFAEIDGLYEYRGDESDFEDQHFFEFASFEVMITDQGRRLWNSPRTPIGFQRPS
jgi:hypothetical protein